MRRKILRWLLGALHLAFWAASAFVLVCFIGALRWLLPGASPSAGDLVPLAYTLTSALGLFTVFYLYDTFWGEREDGQAGGLR